MSFSPSKYPRDYFALYAEACFANFGDRVKRWITINEPLQTAVNAYGIGVFAPGGCQGETARCYLAAHHQILAHAAAVDVYRRKFKVRFRFLYELVV
jgi:beta-glucosidase